MIDNLNQKLREYKYIHGQVNFKSHLGKLGLDLSTKNYLIDLHNKAVNEEYFGESLLCLLMSFEVSGEITKTDVEQLYVLSLEWPHDIQIQPFEED